MPYSEVPTLSTQGSMPSNQGSTASTAMWTAEDKETTPGDGVTNGTPQLMHNFSKHITKPVGQKDISSLYPFKYQKQVFFSKEILIFLYYFSASSS